VRYTAILPFLLVLGAIYFASSGRPGVISQNLPWFADLSNDDSVSAGAGNEIARVTSEFLFNGFEIDQTFSPALLNETLPRIVFLSVSNGSEKARVFVGRGAGLTAAWRAALLQARSLLIHGYQVMWAKLDIVISVRQRTRPSEVLIPGVDGLAFDRQSRIALLAGQVKALGMIQDDGVLNLTNIDKYIKDDQLAGDLYMPLNPYAGYIFSTKKWLISKSGTKLLNPGLTIEASPPSLKQVEENIILMTDQLLTSHLKTKESRPLEENYDYFEGKLDYETTSLTVLAAIQSFDFSEKFQMLRLARKHLDPLLGRVGPCPELGDEYLCAGSGSSGLVQQNALLSLAICSYMERSSIRSMVPTLRGLTNFSIKKYVAVNFPGPTDPPKPIDLDIQSDMTEAALVLFSLTRSLNVEFNGKWLDVAVGIGNYLADGIETGKLSVASERPMWLAIGFENLFRITHDPRYQRVLEKIVESTLESQIIRHQRSEWVGGFEPNLVADYTAGQLTALLISRSAVADPKLSGRTEHAIELALQNLLGFRLQPDAAIYFDNPMDAIKRLQKSHSDLSLRDRDIASGLIAFSFYRLRLQKAGHSVL
jgi:hypothetical protein